jgi:hypothetical protein
LIGSAHGETEVPELKGEANIHLLGVKPYEEAVRFIKAFDVAIIPHLRNQISDYMSPLKLYVYFTLGVPIVTTDVANIDDLAPYVGVGATHEAFLSALSSALGGQQAMDFGRRRELIGGVTWERRVGAIWREIDTILGDRLG